MVKVFLHEILYIESLRNYVILYLENNKSVTTLNSITHIEEKLPEKDFLRIHRSFIIAIHKISSYSPANVELGDKLIPIGRNYKNMVLEELDKKAIQ